MSMMFFEGQLRNVDAEIEMDDGRTMFVLSTDTPVTYPTLAVTGTRFADGGLYLDMKSWHRVDDLDAFKAKLPMLISTGMYD